LTLEAQSPPSFWINSRIIGFVSNGFLFYLCRLGWDREYGPYSEDLIRFSCPENGEDWWIPVLPEAEHMAWMESLGRDE